ncbi:MAG: TRIC cation channel family protein [Tepidiformaceae bacterium]
MDFTAAELIGLLDRMGLVAFALGGVEVGVRRKLDIFGLLVMGVVAATGGGLMRDVIIGRLPLIIERWDYILWPIGGSAFAILLVTLNRTLPTLLLGVAESAGLGAFSAAGALVAIEADLAVPAVIMLAILTATGGGLIRDLLADRVPVVLRSEVNATAAGLGGLAVWAFDPVSTGGAALLGVAVAALVRVAGVAFDLHLPRPGSGDGKQHRLL